MSGVLFLSVQAQHHTTPSSQAAYLHLGPPVQGDGVHPHRSVRLSEERSREVLDAELEDSQERRDGRWWPRAVYADNNSCVVSSEMGGMS